MNASFAFEVAMEQCDRNTLSYIKGILSLTVGTGWSKGLPSGFEIKKTTNEKERKEEKSKK